ncbi:MAG: hypothetical protein JKY48_14975 [Flavobacteriales bacterium]|nr:hypothetical protein [Flavobacteriales bacterium]
MPLQQLETTRPYITPTMPYTEWMIPGKIITIAPHLDMGIQYKQTGDEYQPTFKFWYMGVPVPKHYHFDINNQLDLRHTCRRVITRLATKYTDNGVLPIKTLIEIEIASFTAQ